jgi:hypothetical protein
VFFSSKNALKKLKNDQQNIVTRWLIFLGWLAEKFCKVLDVITEYSVGVIVPDRTLSVLCDRTAYIISLSFRVLSQSRQSLENRFLASIYQYMFCLQFYPAYTSKLVAFLDRLGEEVRG